MRGAEKALLVVFGLLIVGLIGVLARTGSKGAADDGKRCLEQGAACQEHGAGLGQVVPPAAPLQQPGEIQRPGEIQQPGEIQRPGEIQQAQSVPEPEPPAEEPPAIVSAGDFSGVNFACRARYFRALISNNGYSPSTLADYGNYCGKGGSGEPIDAIDACCQAHDNCYGAQDCSIFNNACTAPCNGCDDQAMQCWVAARHADAGRFGRGNDFRYPCYDCSTNDRPNAAKRQRCNSQCRPGMFP